MQFRSSRRLYALLLIGGFPAACDNTVAGRKPEMSGDPQPLVVVENRTVGVTPMGAAKKSYEPLNAADLDLALMPVVTCNQSSLTTAANTASLVMTCNLVYPEGGLASTELWPGSFEWSFAHPALAQNTVTVDSAANAGLTGRFTFSGPDSMRLLYLADTGKFIVKHRGAEATFTLDRAKITVSGESCRVPLGGVINIRQTAGFTLVTGGGMSFNSQPPDQGSRYIVSASNLQTNATSATILSINNSKVTHLGLSGRAIVFDASSFTTDLAQAGIYASPYATVTPGPNVISRFRTELGLCERE